MKSTKKSKNKELNANFSYHRWIWYTYGYLSLARVGIEKLEEENKTPGTVTSFENYFSYRKKYLLIPIIYNIKHAIEIILKALKIQVDKKYIKSHDIVDLNEALKRSIKKLGLTVKQTEFNKFASIVRKYYKLEFFNKNKKIINTVSVFDSQNDIFRFPENSANFILDTENLKNISEENTKELLDDIMKLKSLLGIITQNIKEAKNPELYEKLHIEDEKTWEKEKKELFSSDYE